MPDGDNRLNWPIIGHKNVVNFLQKSIASQKLAHAYFFGGLPHLGKNLVIENFIRALICESKIGCGRCDQCRQVKKGQHPDVFYLNKDHSMKDRKNIPVEEIRELQNKLSNRSFLNSYKIAVIYRAQELSPSAANSLLKTLEEPTDRTILILHADSWENIPETVISRCQIIKFFAVKKKDIHDHLLALGTPRHEAESLAALSHGLPGVAINYLAQAKKYVGYQAEVTGFIDLLAADLTNRWLLLDKLLPSKNDSVGKIARIEAAIDVWLSVLRDLLLLKSRGFVYDGLSNVWSVDRLSRVADGLTVDKIMALIKKISLGKKYINQNINPNLFLENVILNF